MKDYSRINNSSMTSLIRNPLAFIALLLTGGCSNAATNGCFEVILGSVAMSVPQQYLTPTTPRKGNSGNFIFAFDSSIPGIDCPVGCKELFVNISYKGVYTPEQQWISRDPKFTGRMSGTYKIYTDLYDRASSKPLREILVPSEAARPQAEFYSCDREGSGPNPLCIITVVAQNGLVAVFSIPRKVLSRAREATSFVKQSIDQFAENHTKGICK